MIDNNFYYFSFVLVTLYLNSHLKIKINFSLEDHYQILFDKCGSVFPNLVLNLNLNRMIARNGLNVFGNN